MISRRRWGLMVPWGLIHSRSNCRFEQGDVQFDAVSLAVEPEDLVAVHVQQPLELGDQAVQPERRGRRRAGQGGGRHRPPPWRSSAARTVTTTSSSGANLRTSCRWAW